MLSASTSIPCSSITRRRWAPTSSMPRPKRTSRVGIPEQRLRPPDDAMGVDVDRLDTPTADHDLASPAVGAGSSTGPTCLVTCGREDAAMTTRELHAATVQSLFGEPHNTRGSRGGPGRVQDLIRYASFIRTGGTKHTCPEVWPTSPFSARVAVVHTSVTVGSPGARQAV